jgi:hypothetical protein
MEMETLAASGQKADQEHGNGKRKRGTINLPARRLPEEKAVAEKIDVLPSLSP